MTQRHFRLSDITELSQAFAPCTWDTMPDEWSRLNIQIAKDRASRDALETRLLQRSAANHNGKAEPWRVGEWIEGQTVRVRASWRLMEVSASGKQRWEPKLEFEKQP